LINIPFGENEFIRNVKKNHQQYDDYYGQHNCIDLNKKVKYAYQELPHSEDSLPTAKKKRMREHG
jgi:hypothetical protein